MKKQVQTREPKSIKTAIFFVAVVSLLVILALVAKALAVIKVSTYDGRHRYTVAIYSSQKDVHVLSVDPATDTMVRMHITSRGSIEPLEKKVGIPLDAVIYAPVRDSEDVLSTLLSRLVFVRPKQNNMTSFDILRVYFFATSHKGKTTADDLNVTADTDTEKALGTDLNDSAIVQENKTIEIINASEYIGVGSTLERLLTVMGGNVISVKTAPIPSKTSHVEYAGESQYTVDKLSAMTHIRPIPLQGMGIADIRITIGEDDALLPFLH